MEFPEMDLGLIAILVIGGFIIIVIMVMLVINYFQEVKRVEKQREKEKRDLDEVSGIDNHEDKR